MFPHVSVRGVSNAFLYDLETCLASLELPLKLFIRLYVSGELWSSPKFKLAFSPHPKLMLPTLMGPFDRSRTWIGVAVFSLENSRKRFASIPKFSEDHL